MSCLQQIRKIVSAMHNECGTKIKNIFRIFYCVYEQMGRQINREYQKALCDNTGQIFPPFFEIFVFTLTFWLRKKSPFLGLFKSRSPD